MIFRKIQIGLLLLIVLLNACTDTQTTLTLPRSTPEAEGVSSESIINFLDAVAKSKHELHSFMFLRHGKVIAEGWWNPYSADLKHTLYSTSKSFTATAIGFAVSENRLKVSDKVISFFPDYLPDTVSQFLSEMTIKDLLTMSAGQDPDPTFTTVSRDSNWVKSFLSLPIIDKPGTKFLYNSLATYMLSAIVTKVTGEKVVDYLTPRLFKPLNIEGMDWEVDPMGINTGGWGLRLKTEDMAKFGQLFLQKGVWNGKQVLPKEWIEEASTFKIDQAPDATQEAKSASDWMQGYCYQMWRCKNNAYRADGAFGQFIIVMPDQDAVIVLTAESPDMQDEINMVWQHLFPAIKSEKLPVNTEKAGLLKEKLALLALPLPAKSSESALLSLINGKIFTFEQNDKRIESMSLQFNNEKCNLSLKMAANNYQLAFASGAWQSGETTKFGPYLVAGAKANFEGLPPFKVVGAYTWNDANTLTLTLRYIESPHTEYFVLRLADNNISVEVYNSFNPENSKVTLVGTVTN